jgi:hypothetical protein
MMPNEDVIISFSSQDFYMEPHKYIEIFVKFGLMYEENIHFLSLPVYKGRMRTDPAWQLFDV